VYSHSGLPPSDGRLAVARDATAPEGFKQPGLWKSIDWKLMAALVLPLSLDTLDYTGMSTFCTWISRLTALTSSCCNCPVTHSRKHSSIFSSKLVSEPRTH